MANADHTLVNSYSKALFEAARKAGVLPIIDLQTQQFEDLVSADPKFRAFVEAPNIPRNTKEALFDKVFGPTYHPLLLNFVKLLVRRGRLELLFPAMAAFHELNREFQGIRRGVVTTGAPLAPAERQRLESALSRYTNKRLELRYEVDPAVIGGIRFHSGDLLIDHSLAHGLDRLRQELLEGSLS